MRKKQKRLGRNEIIDGVTSWSAPSALREQKTLTKKLIAARESAIHSLLCAPIVCALAALGMNALLATSSAASVNLVRAGQFGSADFGSGVGWPLVTTDGAANLFLKAAVFREVDIDPGPEVHIVGWPYSDIDVLTKFDPAGKLLWSREFRMGATADIWSVGSFESIATDAAGNVYLWGRFGGYDRSTTTADFDPGPGTSVITLPGGVTSYVICKLDPNGNFVWARLLDPTDLNKTNDGLGGVNITVDRNGNVYIAGTVYGRVDFDPGPNQYVLGVDEDGYSIGAFVCKWDSGGAFAWAKLFGGPSWLFPYPIAADPAGNLYVAGDFEGDIVLGTHSGDPVLSSNQDDAFLFKMTTDGTVVWARQFSGTDDFRVGIAALKTDPNGGVVLSGYFGDTVDFDPGPGVYPLTSPWPANSDSSQFIAKLNGDGNFLWARDYPTLPSFESPISDLCVSARGDIFFSGIFHGQAFFNTAGRPASLISNSRHDLYISKLDPDGHFGWARQIRGGQYIDSFLGPFNDPYSASRIAVDSVGGVYLAGLFVETIDADPSVSEYRLTSYVDYSYDGFLVKLDDKPCDINGDGSVDAVDVQTVINIALSIIPDSSTADIDQDGLVNSVDVQKVIIAALGL